MKSQGWAVYGDFTWAISDRVELTAGARYTYDKKEMTSRILDSGGALGNNFNYEFFTNGLVSDSADWDDFTPRLAISFDVNDDVTLYATASRGYKSGGFATFGFDLQGQEINDDGSAPAGTTPLEFDPEQVDSYEIGAKTRLLGNTMQLNASLFRYDYTDLQLVYFDQGSSQVANVGEASGQGLELDLRWVPNDHWDATVGLSLLDTEITDATDIIEVGACGDCDGNNLPFAPEVSASTILTYRMPIASGEGFFTTEYIYRSEMFGGPDNLPDATVESWDEFNFRLGYRSASTWYVTPVGRKRVRRGVFRARLGKRGRRQPVRVRPLQRAGVAVAAADGRHHLRDGVGIALRPGAWPLRRSRNACGPVRPTPRCP